jgi:hypothetical protein
MYMHAGCGNLQPRYDGRQHNHSPAGQLTSVLAAACLQVGANVLFFAFGLLFLLAFILW